jgi:hypothetical protein
MMKVRATIVVIALLLICAWGGLRFLVTGRFTTPTVKDYEKIATSGLPLAQAISDYRNDHGLLPEELGDLVPTYLPSVQKNGWHWNGDTLMHYAGMPHSYVIFWFVGGQAGQWWFRGDSQADNYRLNVPGPATNRTGLTGEALITAKIDGYEQRIQRRPEKRESYEAKISFLAAQKRMDKLRKECERTAKLFPRWWLPQMALAELDMNDSKAEQRFAEWVQQHETFVNYWYLARYYRDKNDIAKACSALDRAATAPFAAYPAHAYWVGAGFAYDAAKFSYENRHLELTIKLCQNCEKPAGSWEAESTLALQAAAELGLGQMEQALNHARRMAIIAKERASWAQDVPELVHAAETQNTNYLYRAGDAAGSEWSLFPEPQP